MNGDPVFNAWMDALESRHLVELTFSEVARALRALSSAYVSRRRLAAGATLDGAGKRAAFALFYGPLHYLLVHHIVRSLGAQARTAGTLLDLGCGTGVSGAAWARATQSTPAVMGIDRNPWALQEAKATYRDLHVTGRVKCQDLRTLDGRSRPAAILAAYSLNELADAERETLLGRLVPTQESRPALLIVEPIAGGAAPWWRKWQSRIEQAGGRSDEWRVRVELPPTVAKLDRAVGLDHRELTGRSLWRPASSSR